MSRARYYDEVLMGNEIANTEENREGMSATDAQNRVKNPLKNLLSNVRDIKDGHRKRFFGYSGAETNNISNKDWLMCFKAHHYRDCPEFDLDKAMQGCRYTQLEPNRHTSDYIIPNSYKSPSSSSEKKKFKAEYDSMYTLLKQNPYYKHMFPSNQDGEVECPTDLTKANESIARFPEEEKIEEIISVQNQLDDRERGDFGPKGHIPSVWSYWGDEDNPEDIITEANRVLKDLKNKKNNIERNIPIHEKKTKYQGTSKRAQDDKAYAIDEIGRLNKTLKKITKEIDDWENKIIEAKQKKNKKFQVPKALHRLTEEEKKDDLRYKYDDYYKQNIEQKYGYHEDTEQTMRDLMGKDKPLSTGLNAKSILKSDSKYGVGGRKKRTKKKRKGRKQVTKKTNKRLKKINRRSKRRRNTRRK